MTVKIKRWYTDGNTSYYCIEINDEEINGSGTPNAVMIMIATLESQATSVINC